MTTLPELLLAKVASAPLPIEIFFRDDDAGWNHAALGRLLDVFARRRMPLDVAVIPAELDESLAQDLRARWDRGDLLGLHQHGYAHCNHERMGRKSEFGSARTRMQQFEDLAAGRRRLAERLAHRCDPIFTPPWNRCVAATRSALRELGFAALSQTVDDSAGCHDGLCELPISLDWQKPRWPRRERAAGAAIGVMLHHASMTDTEFDALDRMLGVLSTLPVARPRLMRELSRLPC